MQPQIITVDLGGTNTKSGIVVPGSTDVASLEQVDTFPEGRRGETSGAIESIASSILRLKDSAPTYSGRHYVSVCVPGIISTDGKILTAGVFDKGNIPLRQLLEDRLSGSGMPAVVHVENDANCGGYIHGVRHGNNQTFMIGTQLGSARYFNGQLVGRNTELLNNVADYCTFDEAGYVIRLDKETLLALSQIVDADVNVGIFKELFDELAADKGNETTPEMVRVEQFVGGLGVQNAFYLFAPLAERGEYSALDLNRLARADETHSNGARKAWGLLGVVLGYAIAQQQITSQEMDLPYIEQVVAGGKVANAFDLMQPRLQDGYAWLAEARSISAPLPHSVKSEYEEPNVLGAAIAFQKAHPDLFR